MTNERVVIEGLVDAARTATAIDENPMCIWSTRSAIETLAYFGIPASPVPCSIRVYNAAFQRFVLEEKRWPTDEDDWDQLFKEHGLWAVGTDPDAPAERVKPMKGNVRPWKGHLVAVAGDILVDLSLMAYTRPQRDIFVEPAAMTVPPGFYEGKAIVGEENRCMVVYEYRGDVAVPRHAPDWKHADTETGRRAIARLIRYVRDYVEEHT